MATKFRFIYNGVASDFDDYYVRTDLFNQEQIWSFGNNSLGQLGDNTVSHRSSPVQEISFGVNWKQTQITTFTSAIKTDGTLWSWGSNTFGQLGDSTTVHRSSAVQVTGFSNIWYNVCNGYNHTLSVKNDGTLWSWGRNSYGQLGDNTLTHRSSPIQTISFGSNWTTVSAGYQHSLAAKNDNTLWGFGLNNYGQIGNGVLANRSSPTQVLTASTNWTDASTSGNHTGAIKNDGTLWIWGTGTSGNLGDGTVVSKSSPVQVLVPANTWTSIIAAGESYAAAIKNDGTLWLWGDNARGNLGDNTATTRSSPVQTVTFATNWSKVALGSSHTAAIKTDGTLWTWGLNTNGQLGDNTIIHRSSPVQTTAFGSTWSAVSCGSSHTLATKTDGTLWLWGSNASGQLGVNDIVHRSSPIQTVAFGTNWSAISGAKAGSHSAALKADGTLWLWGLGTSGQLGDNTNITKSSPVQVLGFDTTWNSVSCGGAFTVAKKTDNTLWCWGLNTNGQLGNNTITHRSSPAQTIAFGTDWNTVKAGFTHTVATKSDGTCWAFGVNTNGGLGDNTTTSRSSPVQNVFGGNTWNNVDAGNLWSFASKSDGTIYAWGYGLIAQLGDNTAASKNFPTRPFSFGVGTNWTNISCKGSHTAAIKSDGTLWCWGLGTSAQLGNNTASSQSVLTQEITYSTNWTQVSAGGSHTAARKIGNTLWSWGSNTFGQLGDGTTTTKSSPVQALVQTTTWTSAVSAGGTHTAAIKSDGSLWLWGGNSYGSLGDNTTTVRSSPVQTITFATNWSKIALGGAHSAAIKTDGTLWTWGKNSYGQLGDNTSTNQSSPIQTVALGTNWSAVSCGADHTLATKTDGTLWLWGRNSNGQLGVNDIVNRSSPVQTVTFGTNWSAISGAKVGSHSAALKSDGTLWLWGLGTSGQLGDNTSANKSSPVQTLTFANNWSKISCGQIHTTAIKTDGTLWVWGSNTIGQLGDNTTIHRSSPVQTTAFGTNWSIVSAGYTHTAATKSDGTCWAFGINNQGTLGDNTFTHRSSPVQNVAGGNNWSVVNSGDQMCVAYKSDGTIWTWGRNFLGALGDNTSLLKAYPTIPFSFNVGSNWTSISCGTNHTLALKADGTLWGWGQGSVLANNRSSSTSVPIQEITYSTNWSKISAGDSHSGGVKTDGTAWTWGLNSNGQLGDGTQLVRSSPTQVISYATDWGTNAGNLAIGPYSIDQHYAAIKTNGTLWLWGTNNYGQLGNNTITNSNIPLQTVSGSTDWSQIAAGTRFTGAIKKDGTLWMWGDNTDGAIGDTTAVHRSSPVQTVAGGSTWSKIIGAFSYALALKTDGTLWGWGSAPNGGLGFAGGPTSPTQIMPGNTWNFVGTAFQHSFFIRNDGTLWGCGFNTSGQLGNNSTANTVGSPTQTISFGTDWSYVSGGRSHTAAIKTDGTLGDGTSINKSSPVQTILFGNDWSDVAAGWTTIIATKTDGRIYSLGVIPSATFAASFTYSSNWSNIACGTNNTVATKTDGTLWAWGANTNGSLGNNTTTNYSAPVQTIDIGTNWSQTNISNFGNMAIAARTDNTLWSFGTNTAGQLGVDMAKVNVSSPVQVYSNTRWNQFSAGKNHSVFIRFDNTLYSSGDNSFGQLGVNNLNIPSHAIPLQEFTNSNNWYFASAGDNHTVAIKTDGTMWSWGYNAYGQLGDNTIINKSSPVQVIGFANNWKQVACGSNHTVAVKVDGTVWCWGRNNIGQLGTNNLTHRSSPVQTISYGSNWWKVAAGSNNTIALYNYNVTL